MLLYEVVLEKFLALQFKPQLCQAQFETFQAKAFGVGPSQKFHSSDSWSIFTVLL